MRKVVSDSERTRFIFVFQFSTVFDTSKWTCNLAKAALELVLFLAVLLNEGLTRIVSPLRCVFLIH